MKKSAVWECKEGCDLSEMACPHLEALLPQMNLGGGLGYMSEKAAATLTMNVFEERFWKYDESEFNTLMRNYGFTEEWDLDLLNAKYFRNLSMRDIEKEFSWTSKSAVQRKLKELHGELVKRGFEQERS